LTETIASVYRGEKDGDPQAQSKAMRALIPALAAPMKRLVSFKSEKDRLEMEARLAALVVQVRDEKDLPTDITGRRSGVIGNSLYLGVPAGMKGMDAVYRLVGLLAHEVAHEIAPHAATLIEEALAQRLASQAL